MFAIPAAPAKQSAGETISILSGRLSSSTLLEDRRAAILGLRSFAKDYPASVASDALRSLIGSLTKDNEDVDTVKIVLETLLMLFSPNEDSPEASDEVALWLADEFTQRQENVSLLLDFLETNDFYSRLYSIKLLVAILSARTERTEECVFTAPLGISRLVAVLDDNRDAVRNEAITLLTFLTLNSLDIQKLVAFESAFDRIFAIIEADGALSEGGRTVEDCLILLANLLRRNTSNQALFRESGCIQKLSDLLGRLLKTLEAETELADWASGQRNRNVYAFLVIIRLFLPTGSVGTSQNQTAFWKHGLAFNVLQLAFSPETEVSLRAEALITCGDIMRDNSFIQENFPQLMVTSTLEKAPTGPENGKASSPKTYVIDGLLDLTLNSTELSFFDVRFAAAECLKAYFSGHADVRLHFLGRAIEGYQGGHPESSNILTVLLHPSDAQTAADPYQYWFAAVVAFHLLYDNPTAKAKALAVTEGDADKGEEVVSSVQTVTAHLMASLRKKVDDRIIIGYLILLLGWLFEDLDAVNEFLSEGSNLQGLIQSVAQPVVDAEIVQGLCTMLLGVVYEFSTADSPIPRTTLHSILQSRLDRDRYLDRLLKLRSHPLVRDFEVTPQKVDIASGLLPDVYLDTVFVNFFKDSYSRISRALDREPGLEISVVTNGVQKGISREMVDSLRVQLDEKKKAVEEAQIAIASAENKLQLEQADHRRSKEGVNAEVSKAKIAQEGLQRSHEAELRKLQSLQSSKQAEHERELKRLQSQATSMEADHKKEIKRIQSQAASKESEHQKELNKREASAKSAAEEHGKEIKRLQTLASNKALEYQKGLEQAKKAAEQEAERAHRRTEAETADLKATISRLEVDLMKAKKSKSQEIHATEESHKKALAEQASMVAALEKKTTDLENKAKEMVKKSVSSEKKAQDLEKQNEDLELQLQKAQTATDEARKKATEAQTELGETKKAKDSTQGELDDLLMVFGDLEEKVAKYKARLKKLGEEVSDGEEDDDGDEDDGDDEEEDDVD